MTLTSHEIVSPTETTQAVVGSVVIRDADTAAGNAAAQRLKI